MLPVVAASAVVWVLLLGAAPLLPGYAAAALYGVGSFICHQIPERSFHLAGFQLPVCARCFGLYFGAAVGALVYVPTSRRGRPGLAALVATGAAKPTLVIAAAPTVVTVFLEMAGLWSPGNVTRAVAALPAGAAAAFVVMSALATLHYDGCAQPRPTAHTPPR